MATELSIRVYLEDTDAGGVVYHASYLRFLERARTESLREAGVDQSRLFEADGSFVVHRMELQFVGPGRLDDRLEVTCRVTSASGAKVVFDQEIRRRGDALLCRARVQCAYVALSTGRPRRLPTELLDALAAPR